MKEINLNLSRKETEKKQVEAMKKLGMTEKEIEELMNYDKAVNKSEKNLPYDLTEEQKKVAEEVTRTTGKKKPTVYQLDNKEGKRNKKKNDTKAELIEKLANFLSDFVEDIEILNAEKLIAFKIGENNYELDLKQKRKPKN